MAGGRLSEEPRALVEQLADRGYVSLRLPASAGGALKVLHLEAARFFSCEESSKSRHMSGDFNFGFRPFGRQYSVTPDRPDMNESFAYWADAPETIPRHDEIPGFITALSAYWRAVSAVADQVLVEIARRLGSTVRVDFEESSYIEINSYFEEETRLLLQDRHEDGHLLTILNSNEAGLEVEVDGTMTRVDFDDDELVIMPGSLLTDMTGGWIRPLFHQVRNHRRPNRQSVLFLVNPSLRGTIEPFVSNDCNRGVDIAERARSNGQGFGLPQAPELHG